MHSFVFGRSESIAITEFEYLVLVSSETEMFWLDIGRHIDDGDVGSWDKLCVSNVAIWSDTESRLEVHKITEIPSWDVVFTDFESTAFGRCLRCTSIDGVTTVAA